MTVSLIRHVLNYQEGNRALNVVAETGLGKSAMIIMLALLWLVDHPETTVAIVCPTDFLTYQSFRAWGAGRSEYNRAALERIVYISAHQFDT